MAGSWPAAPHSVYYFYYQAYSLDVQPVINTGGHANFYPVPARNIVYIDLDWNSTQPFNITLYNMQGQAVKQLQVESASHYSNSIDVSDLATGNYIISINGTQGKFIEKLTIVR
ncbi:MAG TPA: T9SS type A sorting domain-containing protein [Flavipsychrobacter sp.]|nr:T9SS type A sorting domain-containing protein [Flavipsychrobacter sp.]